MNFNATVVYLFDIENGNPNGDPDNDNSPRQFDDGIGYVSSECINSIVRKGWKSMGEDVRIVYGSDKKFEVRSPRDETMKKYIDARTFGMINSIAGENYAVRGCVHTTIAKSFHPVDIEGISIVATHAIDTDAAKKEINTFGKKSFVRYGLYSGFMSIKCENAEANNYTEEDFNKLIEGLRRGFFNNPSACRHLNLKKLIIVRQNADSFISDSRIANSFFDSVKLKDGIETPLKYSDYVVDFSNVKLPDVLNVEEVEV